MLTLLPTGSNKGQRPFTPIGEDCLDYSSATPCKDVMDSYTTLAKFRMLTIQHLAQTLYFPSCMPLDDAPPYIATVNAGRFEILFFLA